MKENVFDVLMYLFENYYMDDDNPAPRLLSRPGEGIYNDNAGALEANSPFQTVWLGEEERESTGRWPNESIGGYAEARDPAAAVETARSFPGMQGMDLAREVTTGEPYSWAQGSWDLDRLCWSEGAAERHVVAYDFGVKRNILRLLSDLDCRLTVVPATTPADEVLALVPDGVFLSNGPGDPAATGEYSDCFDQFRPQRIHRVLTGHAIPPPDEPTRPAKVSFHLDQADTSTVQLNTDNLLAQGLPLERHKAVLESYQPAVVVLFGIKSPIYVDFCPVYAEAAESLDRVCKDGPPRGNPNRDLRRESRDRPKRLCIDPGNETLCQSRQHQTHGDDQ